MVDFKFVFIIFSKWWIRKIMMGRKLKGFIFLKHGWGDRGNNTQSTWASRKHTAGYVSCVFPTCVDLDKWFNISVFLCLHL